MPQKYGCVIFLTNLKAGQNLPPYLGLGLTKKLSNQYKSEISMVPIIIFIFTITFEISNISNEGEILDR